MKIKISICGDLTQRTNGEFVLTIFKLNEKEWPVARSQREIFFKYRDGIVPT